MDDSTYSRFVNSQKNDFSSWINDVFSLRDLSEKIRHSECAKEMAKLLLECNAHNA